MEPMLRKAFVEAAETAAAIAMSAHPRWSEYDNQQLTLTGKIQSVSYHSPYTSIQLKTTDHQVWRVVLALPASRQKRALLQRALQVGQQVKFIGYPNRSRTNQMRAKQIVIEARTVVRALPSG